MTIQCEVLRQMRCGRSLTAAALEITTAMNLQPFAIATPGAAVQIIP